MDCELFLKLRETPNRLDPKSSSTFLWFVLGHVSVKSLPIMHRCFAFLILIIRGHSMKNTFPQASMAVRQAIAGWPDNVWLATKKSITKCVLPWESVSFQSSTSSLATSLEKINDFVKDGDSSTTLQFGKRGRGTYSWFANAFKKGIINTGIVVNIMPVGSFLQNQEQTMHVDTHLRQNPLE